MSRSRLVWCAALLAVLARFPGALWPIRPDEAGFTLVARAWDPEPGSMYGSYWVDRPPLLIALVRASDALGGPLFLRVVAALGCGLLVLAAAATARAVAGQLGASPAQETRMTAWTAVGTAALTSNAMIDLVAAKGEVLALPMLVSCFWLSLRALATRSFRLATAAGLAGALALGLKQNMVAGLVFAGLLFTVEWLRGPLALRELGRLAGGLLLGAAVPVGGTVAWALAAGVRLETLWYAVYGFRSDALAVILAQPAGAPLARARTLVIIFVVSGMVLVLGWFLRHLGTLLRRHPSLTVATGAVLLLDLAGVALGGSYWRPYLFGLVPSCVLALALLTGSAETLGLRWRRPVAQRIIALLVASSTFALSGWVVSYARNDEPPTEVYTGRAIHDASLRRDTMVIYGGRADLQFTSGLASPYEHLWSLPARTLDPGARRLARLLASRRAPTWFVEWVPMDAWDPSVAARLTPILERRYEEHGVACNGRPVYLRRDRDRPPLHLGCDVPWWSQLAQLRDRQSLERHREPLPPSTPMTTGPQD